MPLSDDEERRLDEIERELAYGDPKFAATAVPDRDSQRPLMIATAELFLGIAVLLTGLVISQGLVALGVATVMVGLSIMVRALVGLIGIRHHN
jgi:hypothetical protein